MRVSIWPSPLVRGWQGDPAQDEGSSRFPVRELREALSGRYSSDAHFVPYSVILADGSRPAQIPRINLGGFRAFAAQGCAVVFGGAVFDVDCPAVHKRELPEAPLEWRIELSDAIEALPAPLDAPIVYSTRGGARLVYPFADEVSPEVYQRRWASLAAALRAGGVEVDELRDVTRCYRLPDVVRDGKRQSFGAVEGLAREGLPELSVEAISEIERSSGSKTGGPSEDGARPFAGIEAVNGPLRLDGLITADRNLTLTRLGGMLRRAGLDEAEILATISEVARRRAPDWTPDSGELAHIARSVARYEAPPLPEAVAPPPARTWPSEDDLRFVIGSEAELSRGVCEDLEGEGPALVYDRARLYQYRGGSGVWALVEDSDVQRVVTGYDGQWVGTGGLDKEGLPKVKPLRVSSAMTKGVLDLVRVARAARGFFDGAADGITVANGFVRVTDHGPELEAVSEGQRSIAALPYPYRRGLVPEAFLRALRECFRDDEDAEDRIELLREFTGAALLGMATRYQRGVILLGDGANGKSMILEVLSSLFGPELVVAIPPQDFGQEYRRALLAGARLNVVSELPETEILVSEAVKAVVTGEEITAREIREAPFAFRPRAGHLFAANELPGTRDMSRGFWRRWAVIPFSREFAEHEQDRTLAARIIRDELPALAGWAIDGARELVSRGSYTIPASSEEALLEWRSSADVAARFLDERTAETSTPRTRAADLYEAFTLWCNANGHRPLSSVKFGKRLTLLGVNRERKNDGIYYARALRLALVASSKKIEEKNPA